MTAARVDSPTRGRPKKGGFEIRSDVPAARDPSWVMRSLALLNFLRTEKGITINEIVAWGIARGQGGTMVRQELAWLSFSDLVHHDDERGKWVPGPPARAAQKISAAPTPAPEAMKLLVPWPDSKT